MSTTRRMMKATPQKVWEVLANGWLYPVFVVGASRMREVDDTWPEVGARLHHSVGAWPAMLDDVTESLELTPGSYLRLRAHGWPAGAAEVEFRLEAHADGTTVTLTEDVVAGAGLLVPKLLRDPGIHLRNDETLQRLAYLAERR